MTVVLAEAIVLTSANVACKMVGPSEGACAVVAREARLARFAQPGNTSRVCCFRHIEVGKAGGRPRLKTNGRYMNELA